MQIQSRAPNLPPGHGVTLVKVHLLCSRMPLEATLLSAVHAAAPGCDEACRPCGHIQSVPLTDALVRSSGLAASGGHVEASSMCST